MARLVLVISKSGTGKSSSLRNLKKGEASVVLSSGKELPFRTDIATMFPKSYADVLNAIEKSTAPIIVVDDANYLMSFEEMGRVNEIGYAKFTQMAQNMFKVFKSIIDKESDQTFYVMAHAAESEDGMLRFKTTGKMLSDKVVLEGLTNILITNEITADGEFVFKVKTDGTGVKTPLGMFNTETIPNDLKEVDKAIRAYYGVGKPATKKEENNA
jgi:NAD kinase